MKSICIFAVENDQKNRSFFLVIFIFVDFSSSDN